MILEPSTNKSTSNNTTNPTTNTTTTITLSTTSSITTFTTTILLQIQVSTRSSYEPVLTSHSLITLSTPPVARIGLNPLFATTIVDIERE